MSAWVEKIRGDIGTEKKASAQPEQHRCAALGEAERAGLGVGVPAQRHAELGARNRGT